ncbi:UNVERIFIED_CONTAM: hypothetical protein FKN15_003626, partial [Acipenser sinensis]
PEEEPPAVPTPVRTSSKAKQHINIKAEPEKRQRGKPLLNLVVIGHVDTGKSHLLYLLGNVNKRTMHKYEQESKAAGKASFAYRGVTMDVGMTKFESKTKVITLMDAPDHKGFIPNMITGAAQDLWSMAAVGEFEACFDAGGQTREHRLLVRSLGITQLAVAGNKMDQVLLHYQTVSEPATIRKLVSVLHKSSREVLKKQPKCLTKGQHALVELQAQRSVSLKLNKDFKELGRFMVRVPAPL